jgi:hypothetical protein
MTQTICPYCRRSLSSVDVTREHIVPSALGGSETIPACRECNSTLGNGLEGRLLGPTSWVTLIAQAAGYTPGWVNVTYETGQRATEHFGNRQGRVLDPHIEVLEDTPQRVRLGLIVPPHIGEPYVEHVIRQQKGTVESIERGSAPERLATANLSTNVDDLASLTAKVALCAGAQRWGDDFLVSDLGDWLRRGVLDAGALAVVGPPAGPSPDTLKSFLGPILANYVTSGGAQPWRSPVPSMTIFTPVDHGAATAIAFVLLGLPLCTIANNLPFPGPARTIITFHPGRAPETFKD